METLSIEKFPFLNIKLLQSRISWSITLRWMIVAGYFCASFIADHFFGLPFPYEKIWIALALLAGINTLYFVIFKLYKEFSFRAEILFLQIHIIVDLLFLTLLIHYAGGVENPIYLFYAFHVVLSSILFPGWRPVALTTFVVLLFASIVYLEYAGVLHHYCIFRSDMHSNEFFIFIVLAVFTITVYVTMYICTSFMYIYRSIKRQMDEQNLQLIESDKQKTQFYRFTSHELKSPVVAIKSSIDGVIKSYNKQIDEKGLDILSRASKRSTQMLQIIRELLELSRNRSLVGKKEGELVNINDIILEIAEQEKDHAETKSISLSLELTIEPKMVFGIPSDLKEVCSNVIVNAIRYTKQGGSVFVKTIETDKHILFSVRDTGIGIAEDDLNKVFEEFYRSENAKVEVQLGTGLGLSLVKQIVENNQGQIWIESKLNQGTTVNVRFPIRK